MLDRKIFALIGCHCTKVYTKCAKLVDKKNNRLFCCVSVCNFEPNVLIKGVHLTNLKNNCLIES